MASRSETTAKPQRVIMSLESRGATGIIQLGYYHYNQAYPGLSDHHHTDAMEICFLVKGCQTYSVNQCHYTLRGGDVFITYPNEQHSTGGFPEEKGELYWMVLHLPRRPASLLGMPARDSLALREALSGLPSRHFRGSWKMKDQLDMIKTLYHEPAGGWNCFLIINQVRLFLAELVHSAQTDVTKKTPNPLQVVLIYINNHLGEPMPLNRLAAMAGLSLPRFKARFKDELGMPPAEYVLRRRIDHAIKLLEQRTHSVTSIAYRLGFSSSQYFATVFKRYTGKTPASFHRA
jgi:AraC-like DNA-binding protein